MLGVRLVPLPIWQELLAGVEMFYLRVSPVYWGYGVPKGDGSAAVVIPGLLGTDFYLGEFRGWLRRIGYRPYASSIGLNAECPNLVRRTLSETVDRAYEATGRKVHLIGHSLGGVIARAVAAHAPDRVASVITMAAPFRCVGVHPTIHKVANVVRNRILRRHGNGVLPECYTTRCTCSFHSLIATGVPESVHQTAIYTKMDGFVDWKCCRTGNRHADVEVSATHVGIVFNPIVYEFVARRLAASQLPAAPVRGRRVLPRSANRKRADRRIR